MKDYVFRKKLILILFFSIFIPMLIVFVFVSSSMIGKQKREMESLLIETVDSHQNVVQEVYNNCNMLVHSLAEYSTLNTLLSENKEILIGDLLDYSYEIQNVIGTIMTSRASWKLNIYTENTYIPNMKYIKYMNDEIQTKYAFLNEERDVFLVFATEENKAYLYALKKYRVAVKGNVGYNIIEIRIPIEDVLPKFEGKIYIVNVDEKRNDIISLYGDEEATKLYNTYMDENNRSNIESISYEMEYFDGKFHAFMDRRDNIKVIGETIGVFIAVFIILLLGILWIVQYATQKLTEKLVNIVSAIRYNGIETSLSVEMPCDEFDIIADKITSLANELRRENEKALKLELETLNHKITPHFIYNNLSVLKWKCNDRDIDNIIDCMICYYRNVFQKSSIFAMVEDEVTNLTNYIKMLKFAYEEEFEYETYIMPELMRYKIPSNIIQPLIENAFFHGINNMTGQIGRICLYIFLEENSVVIEVRDNGNKEVEWKEKTQCSTSIIDERIKLYYGSTYGIKHFKNDEYTVVQIQIPYEGREE